MTANDVVLTLDRVADLREEDHAAHGALRLAVYPPEQWANWPGCKLEWASPEWCVRVRDVAGLLVSFIGLYLRDAECDGKAVRLGGIGNVKTHPSARSRGLAAQGMRKAIEFFCEQPDVAFTLLVCEPHLIGYYSRLGWREFGGLLRIRQRGEACDYTLTRVMTHPIQSEAPADGAIDLWGPPW